MPRKKSAGAASTAALIVQIAQLNGQTVDELVTFAIAQFAVGRVAYQNAAKAFIALEERGEDASAKLRAAGVHPSTLGNARYVALVWRKLVKNGAISEAQFDELCYLDCYRLCRISDKVGGWVDVAKRGLALLDREDIESLYDCGKTRAQIEADKVATPAVPNAAPAPTVAASTPAPAVPEAPAATTATATVTTPAASAPPVESTPTAPTVVTPTPTTPITAAVDKPSMSKFGQLCDAVQKMAEDLLLADPSQLEAIHARVMKLAQAVNDAAEAISELELKKAA